MPNRVSSAPLTGESLREALAKRAERLSFPAAGSIADPSNPFSGALRDVMTPAPADVSGIPLPLVEPIWAFWMDAAHLARLTTAFAARQINTSSRTASRGIPKLNLPPPLIASLKAWLTDHRDGTRAAAREASYLAHYGLRLPGTRSGLKPSRFLAAFHAALFEVIRHEQALSTGVASSLVFMLRRLHVELSRSASLIVDGVPNGEVFPRLGESLVMGRADLLTAQWLLASPEIAAALRSHLLVAYPETWMPVLDRLRQLTRTIDSLSLFYHDLAVTSEALLLSIRFGNWMQASGADAANWATFWRDDIARYLVAYQEVAKRNG